MNFNADEIVNLFKRTNGELYNDLNIKSHNYSIEYPNKYHSEGSIWAHICMVMCNILHGKTCDEILPELFMAALLHDIGKAKVIRSKCDIDKNPKMITYGHDGMSTFMALDVLRNMYLNNIDKFFNLELVIKLINLHMIFYDVNNYFNKDNELSVNKKMSLKLMNSFRKDFIFYTYLRELFEADNYGRIASFEEYNRSSQVIDYIWSLNDGIGNLCLEERQKINDKPNKIIMTIGVPGSGKSTFAQDFITKNKDFVILSRDQLVENNLNKSTYNNYNDSFKDEEYQKFITKEFDKEYDDTIKNSKNIIIDMTNLTHKSRNKKLVKIPFDKYYKIAEVFIRPYNDIMKTNNERKDHFIFRNTLEGMMTMFRVPLYDEFDEINYHISY